VAIAYQHVTENPIPPSRLDPEIPPWIDSIVLKSMAKSPADRYQSAGEMRNDIQRGLSGMPVAAPPVAPYQRTQRMGAQTMMAGPGGYGGATGAIPPYQYGPDDDEEIGRPRRWPWWVLGLLIVFGAVGVVAYMLLAGGGKTYGVPQVTGEPVAKAEAQITANHLKPQVDKVPSSTVKAGYVVSTNPPFGNQVAANTVVVLDVSTGPKKVSVPNVTNQTESQAQTALSNANLTTSVKSNPNSTEPAGTVISQSPTAGTPVSPGSTVTITVSGGGVKVPNVIGQTLQVAIATLQGDGLNYQENYVPSTDGTPAGTVVGESPTQGSAVAKGSLVTLTVTKAPATPTTTPPTSPATTPPTSPATTPPLDGN
jgi:serine/threonine-protein kinase